MTTSPALPRRSRPLRAFLLGLTVLVIGIVVFLFGVDLEATATAEGVVLAGDLVEVRAADARNVDLSGAAKVGDEVKSGGVLLSGRINVLAPDGSAWWLVTEVKVKDGERVEEGRTLFVLAPLDPETHQPKRWIALLDLPEEHAVEVSAGEVVRLRSKLYNERTHAPMQAVVERVSPLAHRGDDGRRYYRAVARIDDPPYRLLLGSGVSAEVGVGRKPVWRIILEH